MKWIIIAVLLLMPVALLAEETQKFKLLDDALKKELENSIAVFKKACATGKEEEFRKAISSRFYAEIKNNLASAGQDFPPDLLEQMLKYEPDVSKYTLAVVLQKGETAGLVYVRDDKEAGAGKKPKLEYFFRRFVREGGEWKIDSNYMTGKDKFKADGTAMTVNDVDWPENVAVNGIVKPAEPLMPKAQRSGTLNVTCYGYDVAVSINGVEQLDHCTGKSSSRLIKGGLKNGKNTIKITVRPVKKGESQWFEASVYVTNPDHKSGTKVYSLKPEGVPKGEYEETFEVSEQAVGQK